MKSESGYTVESYTSFVLEGFNYLFGEPTLLEKKVLRDCAKEALELRDIENCESGFLGIDEAIYRIWPQYGLSPSAIDFVQACDDQVKSSDILRHYRDCALDNIPLNLGQFRNK